jgi:hypothetical protein
MAETELGIDYSWLSDATDERLGLAASEGIAYCQCQVRWLQTKRGSVKFWPNRGTDLRQFLLDDAPDYLIASAAEAEVYLDERTVSCTAVVTAIEGLRQVSVNGETDVGPFEFVLSVSDRLVQLTKAVAQ